MLTEAEFRKLAHDRVWGSTQREFEPLDLVIDVLQASPKTRQNGAQSPLRPNAIQRAPARPPFPGKTEI
jgi:hypothetical protein